MQVVYRTIVLLFSLYALGMAQPTGRIQGKIIDAASSRGISDVNVVLSGTLLGSSSTVDGSFEITNVPSGRYRVLASHLGYKPAEQTVVVAAG